MLRTALDLDKNLWGKSPFEVAESVIRRQQNTSGQVLKQKCRNTVCVEFSATTQSCCERSLEGVNRVTEIGTFPLFAPNAASEKEIVRDVTEKRLLHRVFITTQSPNRLPQRRRLFVVSQRNVCYIVFSSRHILLTSLE